MCSKQPDAKTDPEISEEAQEPAAVSVEDEAENSDASKRGPYEKHDFSLYGSLVDGLSKHLQAGPEVKATPFDVNIMILGRFMQEKMDEGDNELYILAEECRDIETSLDKYKQRCDGDRKKLRGLEKQLSDNQKRIKKLKQRNNVRPRASHLLRLKNGSPRDGEYYYGNGVIGCILQSYESVIEEWVRNHPNENTDRVSLASLKRFAIDRSINGNGVYKGDLGDPVVINLIREAILVLAFDEGGIADYFAEAPLKFTSQVCLDMYEKYDLFYHQDNGTGKSDLQREVESIGKDDLDEVARCGSNMDYEFRGGRKQLLSLAIYERLLSTVLVGPKGLRTINKVGITSTMDPDVSLPLQSSSDFSLVQTGPTEERLIEARDDSSKTFYAAEVLRRGKRGVFIGRSVNGEDDYLINHKYVSARHAMIRPAAGEQCPVRWELVHLSQTNDTVVKHDERYVVRLTSKGEREAFLEGKAVWSQEDKETLRDGDKIWLAPSGKDAETAAPEVEYGAELVFNCPPRSDRSSHTEPAHDEAGEESLLFMSTPRMTADRSAKRRQTVGFELEDKRRKDTDRDAKKLLARKYVFQSLITDKGWKALRESNEARKSNQPETVLVRGGEVVIGRNPGEGEAHPEKKSSYATFQIGAEERQSLVSRDHATIRLGDHLKVFTITDTSRKGTVVVHCGDNVEPIWLHRTDRTDDVYTTTLHNGDTIYLGGAKVEDGVLLKQDDCSEIRFTLVPWEAEEE